MSLVGGVTVIDWFPLYSTSGCAPGLEGIECVTTDELLDAKTTGLGWAPHAQVLAAGRTAIASFTALESKPVVVL
jgi:hypothetical protein